MDAIEKSQDYFNSGYGCAEAVLLAIANVKNIRSVLIPRIATGFCGGMGRTDGMCGAVTGGILALNLILGRNGVEESNEANYKAVQKLIQNFRLRFGEVNCTALTGCNLSNETGREMYNEKNMHPVCAGFVGETTRIILGLI